MEVAIITGSAGNRMNYSYTENNRIGDHIWWISDVTKFKTQDPEWIWKYSLDDILSEMHDAIALHTSS